MPAERLVLIRHGRTASNASGRWQGRSDIPLDDVGLAQAVAVASALPSVEVRPARLVSSDLSRAVSTALPLAEAYGVPLETDSRLQEVWAGSWEGLTKVEIGEQWPADLEAWSHGEDVVLGGGERISEAGARVADAITDLAAATDGGTLMIVSHGGVLRGATQRLCGVDYGVFPIGVLRNANWAVLFLGRSGGWRLDSWNLSAPMTTSPSTTAPLTTDGADRVTDPGRLRASGEGAL